MLPAKTVSGKLMVTKKPQRDEPVTVNANADGEI